MACLRATFEGLDKDGDGRLSVAELFKALNSKLPEEEVGAVTVALSLIWIESGLSHFHHLRESVLLQAACQQTPRQWLVAKLTICLRLPHHQTQYLTQLPAQPPGQRRD